MLVQLFAHLEGEIGRVTNMKQTLLDQMEAKVRELLAQGKTALTSHPVSKTTSKGSE